MTFCDRGRKVSWFSWHVLPKIFYTLILRCQFWTINEKLINIFIPMSSLALGQMLPNTPRFIVISLMRRVSSWFCYLYWNCKIYDVTLPKGSQICDQLWQRRGKSQISRNWHGVLYRWTLIIVTSTKNLILSLAHKSCITVNLVFNLRVFKNKQSWLSTYLAVN